MKRSRRNNHARLAVSEFGGFATRIEYRRANRTFYHVFKTPKRMYLTDDSKHLIIAPVKVRAGQLHD